MATWSNGISLRGLTGPQSIVTVTAPPGPTVGVVDGYAVWNNNGIVLLYGPKTASGWPQVGGAAGSGNPASVQLTGQTGQTGAAGVDGNTIIPVTGQPDNTLGKNGDYGLDFGNAFLYGPKAAGAWPTQPISIVGPRGQDASLGVDLSGNSLSLSPLNNAAVASGIKQVATNGSVLFASDTAGNVQAAGTLKVTGATTMAAATVSGLTNTGNESVGGTLSVTGATTLASVNASNVSASGTLNVTGASTLATASVTGLSNSGNETVAGTLNVTGTSTFGTAKVTTLNFNDGTSQTTAASGSGSGSGTALDTIYMGLHYAANGNYPTAYTASNGYFTNTQFVSSTSVLSTGSAYMSDYAGTVFGIKVFAVTTSQPITVALYKNGTITSLTATSTTSGGGFYTRAPAGSPITFAAGDLLQLFIKGTTASMTNSCIGWVTVKPNATP